MLPLSLPSTELGEQLVQVEKKENITQLSAIYYVWLCVAATLHLLTNGFYLQIVILLVTGYLHYVSIHNITLIFKIV